jgi:hypothetical protein
MLNLRVMMQKKITATQSAGLSHTQQGQIPAQAKASVFNQNSRAPGLLL